MSSRRHHGSNKRQRLLMEAEAPQGFCQQVGCDRAALADYSYCQFHRRCQECNLAAVPPYRDGAIFCKLHHPPIRAAQRPYKTQLAKKCEYPDCTKNGQFPRTDQGELLCVRHGGGKRCFAEDCNAPAILGTQFCKQHGGKKLCASPGCHLRARLPKPYCRKHGGGTACKEQGCDNYAYDATSGCCLRHGGGRRCAVDDCDRLAAPRYPTCPAHGGGDRCQVDGCQNVIEQGYLVCRQHGGRVCAYPDCDRMKVGGPGLPYCVRHGGGPRCQAEGCNKGAAHVGGGAERLFCVKHGGGKRCQYEGCQRSAVRKSFCTRHGGGVYRCAFEGGCDADAAAPTKFCREHGGGRKCVFVLQVDEGGDQGAYCQEYAVSNSKYCAAHSSRRVCKHEDCNRRVFNAKSDFCKQHGEGVDRSTVWV